MEVNVSRTASASKSVVTSVTFGAAGVPLKGLRHVKSGVTLIGPPRARRGAHEVKVRAGGWVLVGVERRVGGLALVWRSQLAALPVLTARRVARVAVVRTIEVMAP